MKDYIIQLLKQSDDYLSGEILSQQLGVTRAAVWKAIKSLQQDGYPIMAVTNRGYRLTGQADILSAFELQDAITKNDLTGFIQKICFEKAAGSTNLEAKRAAELGAPDGSLFVAERQHAGRGRRGRTWVSDHHQGLWFSLLLRPPHSPAELARITLFAGLCTALAIRRSIGVPVGIKWPNDLVSQTSHRKIGGILTEMVIEENAVSAVVIGIGLNVNTLEFPPELAPSATSLALESGQSFCRTDILAAIIREFANGYPSFLAGNGWLEEYRSLCLTLNREVRVVATDCSVFEGRAVDLDPAGELIVEDLQGQQKTVRSGEVSVRGLLGYV